MKNKKFKIAAVALIIFALVCNLGFQLSSYGMRSMKMHPEAFFETGTTTGTTGTTGTAPAAKKFYKIDCFEIDSQGNIIITKSGNDCVGTGTGCTPHVPDCFN
jgi:hypothetical protein